jgi:protocatechuate 3,4-dioxygenase beta subunit
MTDRPTRRHILASGALAGIASGLLPELSLGQTLPPTPECNDHGPATPRQTEGPYYKPKSPERADLYVPGMAGQPLELTGRILTRRCRPLAGALLDVWQADHKGDYDNAGFGLRGHQTTGPDGVFRLRTVVPGAYPGRTRHIHVKVRAPIAFSSEVASGSREENASKRGAIAPLLTTQLYFPGEALNARDGLFRRDLTIRTAKAEGWLAGRFDFVLDME